jgi:hypothetical protein
MKPLLWMLATSVFLSFSSLSNAAMFERVIALEPQFFESFEDSYNLDDVMNGLASVTADGDTTVVVQNGNFFNLWDQHAFDGSQFLGASHGYGVPATIEIEFQVPVEAFGGVFGHRVRPGLNTSGETEFVFYDSRNRKIGRDSVFIGSEPGGVPAYWQFSRDVKRITITSIHPMADALVANLTPLQTRKLMRKVPTAGVGGIGQISKR